MISVVLLQSGSNPSHKRPSICKALLGNLECITAALKQIGAHDILVSHAFFCVDIQYFIYDTFIPTLEDVANPRTAALMFSVRGEFYVIHV